MIEIEKQLEALVKDFKMYNPDTYYHCLRTKNLTYKMTFQTAKNGFLSLSPDNRNTVCKGAMLHDIGKSELVNRILTIPGPISEEEREHLKKHPVLGYEKIKDLLLPSEAQIISDICLYHHERVDGKGYLGVSDIPKYVQIVSICDAYDALTSERVYRPSFSKEEALEMISSDSCGVFDPLLKDALAATVANM